MMDGLLLLTFPFSFSNVLQCTLFVLLFLPVTSTFPITDLYILFLISPSISPLPLIFPQLPLDAPPSSAHPSFPPLPPHTAYCTVPIFCTLYHPPFLSHYLSHTINLVLICVITTTGLLYGRNQSESNDI